MDRSDEDVHGLVDQAASAVDDDHGAIFEICHSLIRFLAFAKDKNAHSFAGKKRGPHRVGEKVHVENADALHAGNFIEIEVVGDNPGAEAEGKLDEFAVNFIRSIGIIFDDADFKSLHLLDALQDFESAAPALTTQAVGGVSDHLQLVQDELRNQQRTIEEMGFADIRDPAVNQRRNRRQRRAPG